MPLLAVIILTHNEELHIARALDSIAKLDAEVFIIDSYSTDRTLDLAAARGATILQHPFVNQARQFQWAIETAPITAPWILRLDADEVIEPDLVAEIQARLPALPADVVGGILKRKHIFMDRWVRHGGRYPLMMLRLFRRGHGRIEDRWMDEHIVTSGGRSVVFQGGFADHNLKDLTFWADKHNKYATREAVDVLSHRYGLFDHDSAVSQGSASWRTSLKRWLKEGFYDRLPLWAGPLAYFLYRYFIQLGFLDGYPGLIYHYLQGGAHRFLVAAKVYEYDRTLKACTSLAEREAALLRLTGLSIR